MIGHDMVYRCIPLTGPSFFIPKGIIVYCNNIALHPMTSQYIPVHPVHPSASQWIHDWKVSYLGAY